jgi:hypothetical protein
MVKEKEKGKKKGANETAPKTTTPMASESDLSLIEWLNQNDLPQKMVPVLDKHGVRRPKDLATMARYPRCGFKQGSDDLPNPRCAAISKDASLTAAESERLANGIEEIFFAGSRANGWDFEKEWSMVKPFILCALDKEIVDCVRVKLERNRMKLDIFTLLLGIISTTLGAAFAEGEEASEGDAACICDGGDHKAADDADTVVPSAISPLIFSYGLLCLNIVLTFALALKKLFKMDERIQAVQALQQVTNQLVGLYKSQLSQSMDERLPYHKFQAKVLELESIINRAEAIANITADERANCALAIKAGGGNWQAIKFMYVEQPDTSVDKLVNRPCWRPLSSFPHLKEFDWSPVRPSIWHDHELCKIYIAACTFHTLNMPTIETLIEPMVRASDEEYMAFQHPGVNKAYLEYKSNEVAKSTPIAGDTSTAVTPIQAGSIL